MSVDWKQVAPKRADWERLIDIFKEAGLPHCSFRNGEPKWSAEVDQMLVEKIAGDYQTSGIDTAKKSSASPSPPPTPKKRGRGRPKKNK